LVYGIPDFTYRIPNPTNRVFRRSACIYGWVVASCGCTHIRLRNNVTYFVVTFNDPNVTVYCVFYNPLPVFGLTYNYVLASCSAGRPCVRLKASLTCSSSACPGITSGT
jgi:hypothetical protein